MILSLIVIAFVAQPTDSASPSLKTQLESYFQSPKDPDRAKIADSIVKGHRIEEITAELPRLELWSKTEIGNDWKIKLPSGQTIQATVRLPVHYDTSKPIPLILACPQEKSSGGNTISTLMSDPKIQHAWVAIDKPVGGSFYQSVAASADLAALLREIRRRIHTDIDRTYIIGEQAGADAAWMAAIMYPHPFAGIIAFSGFPRIPYAEQSYPILLQNLRGTPFLSAWTEEPKGTPPNKVQAANEAIAHFAIAADLPFATATLAPRDGGVKPFPGRIIAAAISKPREPQSRAELWFRYLPQGNAGWLRATELAGEIWDEEQISIESTAVADRDEFIAETVKQKLFYIGGHIDGETITVETKRVGGVELRLSPAQVDFLHPVTIVINGRKREITLEPSAKDMLELAYEEWDFQHPVYVRKTFTINAK